MPATAQPCKNAPTSVERDNQRDEAQENAREAIRGYLEAVKKERML